jgi:hypothetical protein
VLYAAGLVCAAAVERDEARGIDLRKVVADPAVHGATFEMLEICMMLLRF